jgi:anthranilate synthase/aminodeoxychorismate synthase-like glutamine amidotransferase
VRIVFVDNFDSFTFNLVDEFARRGCEIEVWRNTASAEFIIDRAESADGPGLIVISPGPGRPADAGCCPQLMRMAAGRVPVFGVCLGHQVLLETFGAVVEPAQTILHGRSSQVTHRDDALFRGIPSPFVVGRYHSLAGHSVPEAIEPLAWADSIVMAARHRRFPLFGVQFHPESVLTPQGGRLIENVLGEAVATGEG